MQFVVARRSISLFALDKQPQLFVFVCLCSLRMGKLGKSQSQLKLRWGELRKNCFDLLDRTLPLLYDRPPESTLCLTAFYVWHGATANRARKATGVTPTRSNSEDESTVSLANANKSLMKTQ